MRLLIVSDIHGRYNQFIKLLKYAGYKNSDYLFNLGDMVDRGPDSYKVVEWFRTMNIATDGRVQCLFGNHEHIFISYHTGHIPEKDYCNKFIGGQKALDSYSGKNNELITHIDFMSKLPLYLETDDYVFTHGGLDINKPLHKQSVHDCAWDYNKLYQQDVNYKGKTIVYGHTPTIYIYEHYGSKGYEIWKTKNQIAVDVGFSKARKLLIYDLTNDIEYYYDFASKKCYTVNKKENKLYETI